MIRYEAIISGRVQGVGFRVFTQAQAVERSLTGWVKNEANGDVHLEVQGEEATVYRFLDRVKQAQFPAKVDSFQTTKLDTVENEKDFKIK
ncbi:acylphosphatase [Paenalkalicoccus suaedae]|uniref:Acylphosphatase n=1 Tax=Paenalkalicoccus suaedae TaxID=2592382 RepID=A0A859FBC6_9BACI|nr:acylphosphatase [Paenalkalicoccus suaedae]QKS70569.1 acylphosphatase [Paenalkalicoccus suaedae]